MSRGRPPRMACREACTSAQQRGKVLDAAGIAKSRFDFVLFTSQKVTFVRVKRSHSRILAAGEVYARYHGDVAEIRKIPLTPVVSRELWILLPWGTWQRFCIGDDIITEIPEDSGKDPGTQVSPPAVAQGQRGTGTTSVGTRGAFSPGP